MADGDEGGEEGIETHNHREMASDSFFEAISNASTFLTSTYLAAIGTLDDHPWVQKAVEAVFLTVFIGFLGNLLGWGIQFFYGAAIPVERDFLLGTFPAPIGLSLWALLGALLITNYVTWKRLNAHRRRIEELEAE